MCISHTHTPCAKLLLPASRAQVQAGCMKVNSQELIRQLNIQTGGNRRPSECADILEKSYPGGWQERSHGGSRISLPGGWGDQQNPLENGQPDGGVSEVASLMAQDAPGGLSAVFPGQFSTFILLFTVGRHFSSI